MWMWHGLVHLTLCGEPCLAVSIPTLLSSIVSSRFTVLAGEILVGGKFYECAAFWTLASLLLKFLEVLTQKEGSKSCWDLVREHVQANRYMHLVALSWHFKALSPNKCICQARAMNAIGPFCSTFMEMEVVLSRLNLRSESGFLARGRSLVKVNLFPGVRYEFFK